ncbi:HAD domain-containing protein [Pseudomonas luteola]
MIVFIDMDGPFNSMRNAMLKMRYDPVGAKAASQLLSHPGVITVLSASVRHTCRTPEEATETLKRRYGLKGMTFHSDWKTGHTLNRDEGKHNGRSKEIAAWIAKNGRDQGERYYAIDDEPIDVDGVHHIKADYNGLPFESIMFMKHLMGEIKEHEYTDWLVFIENRKREEAKLILGIT